MNGKVNAVTLGLANLFTKAQVKQATQGVVKSVNNVTPDESGNVETHDQYTALFTLDGTSVSVDCDISRIKQFNSNGRYLLYVPPTDPLEPKPTYLCTDFSTESIYLGGGVYFKLIYRLYFGENIPVILVDAVANTVSIDPDWVAPEPTATQTYVQNAIAPVQEDVTALESDVDALESNKVSLPMANSAPDPGTAGQFAVSDGNGGITWKTLAEAEGVDY